MKFRRTKLAKDRFFEKVKQDGDCWIWTGASGPHGYGTFWQDGKYLRAHRWSYGYLRSEIPDGLQVDHLCRRRLCVNPWHLEPVTPAVNTERSTIKEMRQKWSDARTHCKHGHPLSGENLYVQPSTGYRYCRICQRRNSRNYLGRKALKEAIQ